MDGRSANGKNRGEKKRLQSNREAALTVERWGGDKG